MRYKALKFIFLISDSELLEKLCLSLYDVLRPLIIHIMHLETLSELCSILKTEMLEDHVHNNSRFELFSSQSSSSAQLWCVTRTAVSEGSLMNDFTFPVCVLFLLCYNGPFGDFELIFHKWNWFIYNIVWSSFINLAEETLKVQE